MSRETEQTRERLHQLSALMDGEVDALSSAAACQVWRDDAAARSSWHVWHVIGDVLRSDELVRDARRDAAFVATLRARLESEPVVVAPQRPSLRARSSRSVWTGAAAAAAGLAVVVGAGLLMRPTAEAPLLAAAPVPSAAALAPPEPVARPVVVAVDPSVAAEPQVLAADGQLIRDARLDRYLAAHKPFSGNPALAVQSSFAGTVRARTGDR